MPKLYPEALLFCILWAALAFLGWSRVGWQAAAALTLGLFVIIMPASAYTLSRTGNFAIERGVRWSILIVAALITLSLADLG
ncbi:hypothetical protein [Allosphingosinicella deserti]|uniref:Uncharacterized protein n=1 Tax=Allosphingosinicella deserti TaxID=2116704 RepID=A0A2P7QV35_9SPHN|nr:hypothetical protein [Sphingomonas deserti]PSJ41813.1 hypothetical protein C7I55_05940 [Sphingomonas deserti]